MMREDGRASLYVSREATTSAQIDGWFGEGQGCGTSPLAVSIFCQLATENEDVGGTDLKSTPRTAFG